MTNMDNEEKIAYLTKCIKSYPDFPQKGILFRDMFSLVLEPKAFQLLKEILVEYVQTNIADVDVICGLDSRGFIFGSILAIELHLPFVPIRKGGKLPGEVYKASFKLEYGEDSFEMQKNSVKPGQKVLIIDDLLATGGSMEASIKVIEEAGGVVKCCLAVMELIDLKGRDKLNKYLVKSFIEF